MNLITCKAKILMGGGKTPLLINIDLYSDNKVTVDKKAVA